MRIFLTDLAGTDACLALIRSQCARHQRQLDRSGLTLLPDTEPAHSPWHDHAHLIASPSGQLMTASSASQLADLPECTGQYPCSRRKPPVARRRSAERPRLETRLSSDAVGALTSPLLACSPNRRACCRRALSVLPCSTCVNTMQVAFVYAACLDGNAAMLLPRRDNSQDSSACMLFVTVGLCICIQLHPSVVCWRCIDGNRENWTVSSCAFGMHLHVPFQDMHQT